MRRRFRVTRSEEEEDDGFVPPTDQVVFDYDSIASCLDELVVCSEIEEQIQVMRKLALWVGGWPRFLFEKMGPEHLAIISKMIACEHPCLIPALECICKFSKFNAFEPSVEVVQSVAAVLVVMDSQVQELALNILGNVAGRSFEVMTELYHAGIPDAIASVQCLRIRTQKLTNWAMSQFLRFQSDFDLTILAFLGENCDPQVPNVAHYAILGFCHALKWSHNVIASIQTFNIIPKVHVLLESCRKKPILCSLKFITRLAVRDDFDVSSVDLIEAAVVLLCNISAIPEDAYHQTFNRCLKLFILCASNTRLSRSLFAQIASVGMKTLTQGLTLKDSQKFIEVLLAARDTATYTLIPAIDLSRFISDILVCDLKPSALEHIAHFLTIALTASTWSREFASSLIIEHNIVESLWEKADASQQPLSDALQAIAEMYERNEPNR